MHIVCLGELLVDMFPAELGRKHAEVSAFRPVPGGAPANVAVAAARLGARSAFIGKVGDDPFGRWLADVLAEKGVDVRGLRFDRAARTTMNIIAQPDANSYECLFYRNPGADMLLSAGELDRTLLAQAGAFHFGSLSLTDEPARGATSEAIRLAREGGALISFDVNYRPTLWRDPAEAHVRVSKMIPYADLLKVNEGELALLAGAHLEIGRPGWEGAVDAAAASLLARGPSLVVVTLGPLGSFYRTEEEGGYIAGFPVRTVDATGCGDAFIAGLLWQLVRGTSPLGRSGEWRQELRAARLRDILRYANAVGALTATQQGVIPALPPAAAVTQFLAAHPSGTSPSGG